VGEQTGELPRGHVSKELSLMKGRLPPTHRTERLHEALSFHRYLRTQRLVPRLQEVLLSLNLYHRHRLLFLSTQTKAK